MAGVAVTAALDSETGVGPSLLHANMSAAQRVGISQSRPILMILPPELPALISGMAIVYLPNEGLVGVLNSRFPAEPRRPHP